MYSGFRHNRRLPVLFETKMMTTLQPIFWHQGLFLQPQHFQHSDQLGQARQAQIATMTSPHPWGVVSVRIDEGALETLHLRINALSVLMRDGSLLSYPGNAIIETRGFDLASIAEGRTAYIGLRRMIPGQDNVCIVDSPDQAMGADARLAAAADPVTVADAYTQGPEGQVDLMSYVLRLFWDDELDALGHYETMPLLRLEQDGDRARIQHQFIPPCLNIAASPVLLDQLRQIRDEISGRARQLEVFKPTSVAKTEDIDANHVSLLMALSVLNRYGPLLNHLLEAQQTHPWHVYGVLRQMVGELSTFSDRYDMMGETRDGHVLIPPYQHDDLAPGMAALTNLIRLLLNEIAAAPEMLVRLQPAGASPGLYSAELPDGFFGKRHRYHLLVHGGLEGDEHVDALMRDIKLAAPDQIEILVTHALGGVGLMHLAEPPRGIPRRSGALYFYIDPLSEAWTNVEEAHEVALFAAGAPADLQVELIVSKW